MTAAALKARAERRRPGPAPVTAVEFDDLMMACPRAAAARALAVGVSGGADSMALALLAGEWARKRGVRLTALTVDHGLRPAAAGEAAQVAQWLGARGIRHHTLTIRQTVPASGIQKAARDWRFAAFDQWRRVHGAAAVLLAHTAEDQAETVLMRAAADSGPDGLAGMRTEARVAGLPVTRPLLELSGRRLRETCHARGQDWIEDPSNQDATFTRVRFRGRSDELGRLGLDTRRVGRFARAMGTARDAIDRHCGRFLREHAKVMTPGIVRFERARFAETPEAFRDLLLARLLRAVGGGAFAPRSARVMRLRTEISTVGLSGARTLGGCGIAEKSRHILVFREPAACADPVVLKPGVETRWDNRFEAVNRTDQDLWLGPLGPDGWTELRTRDDAASQIGGLRALPHAARLSFPALRELDGRVRVPHFVGGIRKSRTDSSSAACIRFVPDAEWMEMLAVPEVPNFVDE